MSETRSVASLGVRGRNTCKIGAHRLHFCNAKKVHTRCQGCGLKVSAYILHIKTQNAPNKRKTKRRVIRIHLVYFLSCRRSEYFDNFDELVDARVAGKKRLAEKQLGKNRSGAPNVCKSRRRPFFLLLKAALRPAVFWSLLTDARCVIGGAEYELGCAIVARANIGDVWLAGRQNFRRAKIAQFDDRSFRVEKQILRLHVAMANARVVNVGERAKHLIHISLKHGRKCGTQLSASANLDIDNWDVLSLLAKVPRNAINLKIWRLANMNNTFDLQFQTYFLLLFVIAMVLRFP